MRVMLCILASVCPISSCIAGVVFEIESRDHSYSPPRTESTTVLAQGLALKVDNRVGQRALSDSMIYRGDRREMVVVDHERKTYMVVNKQFVENIKGQLSRAAQQAQGMLNHLPPDQRAMIEQMTKNGSQIPAQQVTRPKLAVTSTKQRAKVYGYPCVLFQVIQDGRKIRDVWVTDWNNIQGGPDLAATFDSMSDFFQELVTAFGMGDQAPMNDNAFATMRQMGGFPVAAREYRNDGTVESEWALRSAKVKGINLADLEVPINYRQETMPGGDLSLGRSQAAGGNFGQARR